MGEKVKILGGVVFVFVKILGGFSKF